MCFLMLAHHNCNHLHQSLSRCMVAKHHDTPACDMPTLPVWEFDEHFPCHECRGLRRLMVADLLKGMAPKKANKGLKNANVVKNEHFTKANDRARVAQQAAVPSYAAPQVSFGVPGGVDDQFQYSGQQFSGGHSFTGFQPGYAQLQMSGGTGDFPAGQQQFGLNPFTASRDGFAPQLEPTWMPLDYPDLQTLNTHPQHPQSHFSSADPKSMAGQLQHMANSALTISPPSPAAQAAWVPPSRRYFSTGQEMTSSPPPLDSTNASSPFEDPEAYEASGMETPVPYRGNVHPQTSAKTPSGVEFGEALHRY